MTQKWLEHALRDSGWRFQRQAVALIALGLFVGILIGALYLAQAASVATLGRQLEALIARRNQLEQVNEQLRSEISQLRSVPRLLARAQELGFLSADDREIEYLYIDGYNPRREEQASSSVPAVESTPVPAYEESFTGWLQQQWDALRRQLQGFAAEGPQE